MNGGGRPARRESFNPLSRDNEEPFGYGPARRGRGARGPPTPYSRPQTRSMGMAPMAPAPYVTTPTPDAGTSWKHDMYTQQVQGGDAKTNRLEFGSSILVSNLDTEVSADDVKTIFGALGEVVKAVVNYDKEGNSLGTAEVTFAKSDDAQKAVEEYDGAEVDGRAMYIKVISTLLPPPPKQFVVTPNAAKLAAQQQMQHPADYGFARPRRTFNVVRGRGRGRGRGPPPPPRAPMRGGNRGGRRGTGGARGGPRRSRQSSESGVDKDQLDDDLDNYHTQGGGKPVDSGASGQPKAPVKA